MCGLHLRWAMAGTGGAEQKNSVLRGQLTPQRDWRRRALEAHFLITGFPMMGDGCSVGGHGKGAENLTAEWS